MRYTQTHLQFFQVLDRLKRLDWSKQFQTLRPSEFIALCTLRNYHKSHPDVPGMYVSAFAKELNIPAPAASKLLGSMESNGWITRMVDPSSRRKTFIQMTPEGIAIHEQEADYSADMGLRIFERMGSRDLSALLSGLNQLLTIMEEEFQSE